MENHHSAGIRSASRCIRNSSEQEVMEKNVKPTNDFICIARSAETEQDLPQGCQFSPDGLCVLTSVGKQVQLFNTPPSDSSLESSTTQIIPWKTALVADGGDTVRSYTWYPLMSSTDTTTSCFVATSRDQPIHLYDAYTSAIRATYSPYNEKEEMESPTVVDFTPDGQRIICGGFRTDRCLHIFQTALPGKDSTYLKLGKTRRSSDGQKGLVSALACSSLSTNLVAVGTYSPGSIYLYDDRVMSAAEVGTILQGVCVVGHGKGHASKKRRFVDTMQQEEENSYKDLFSSAKVKWFQKRAQGGVTQLKFSPQSSHYLYSSSRRSDAVLCWDIRIMTSNMDQVTRPICGFKSYPSDNDTNQRLEFDLDAFGDQLFVGGRDKCVRIYDAMSGVLKGRIVGLQDAANGVSYNSHHDLLAVAVGARQFPSESDYDTEEATETTSIRGYLELYKLHSAGEATPADQ
jgi:WD40 repeat protein